MTTELLTPYERGNKNQTTTWQECIHFYQNLASRFPQVLKLIEIGTSDGGVPLHAGVVASDGLHDLNEIKRTRRPVFFNNNGIHPGEPEGIDACMALVRDFCTDSARLAALNNVVFLFVPIYNVDGCKNRNAGSRVNQVGPEFFGFRGNALNLDLNRDFIKCDSLNAQAFNRFFSAWDPDVMVDTHTSNGADYSYTMTVIQTQADKLGGALGQFLRDHMMPTLSQKMTARGWPFCPYVNPVHDIPDDGIEDFLETPRFSTGYAALNHTLGMMPETHMLKPYADRYESMRALVEEVLAYTVANAAQIQALRQDARAADAHRRQWPLQWKVNRNKPSKFRFRGFTAVYSPSQLGNYTRLSYDRSKPWEKDIDYFQHFEQSVTVAAPGYYVIPQEWRDVIERLQWNGLSMERVTEATAQIVQTLHIKKISTRPTPYEGHMFHDEIETDERTEMITLKPGDYLLSLNQPKARYAVETLEPLAHDSFFRWGFFNSILEKKETFSDYVFEDTASELLETEPDLKDQFNQWKKENPHRLSDQTAVLNFIFSHCRKYAEPEWLRYPVYRIMQDMAGLR